HPPSRSPTSRHQSSITNIRTLSLHDALPIFPVEAQPLLHVELKGEPVLDKLLFFVVESQVVSDAPPNRRVLGRGRRRQPQHQGQDRKSTRLNSSHVKISYAVFCLKKKKKRKR